MAEIIPTILTTKTEDYIRQFKTIENLFDWIQIDIVDGRFAPNKTIDDRVVKSIRTAKNLEIHLMVRYIEDWVDKFIKIPTVKRIIFPIESASDPHNLIRHLRRHQVGVGVGLNPYTPVEDIAHVISNVDVVLLLSVNPGFQGQTFIEKTYEKILKVREMRPDVPIEVDGNIRPGIAKKCVELGANILLVGSFLLSPGTPDFTSPENAVKIKGETYAERVASALEALKEDIEGVTPVMEPSDTAQNE